MENNNKEKNASAVNQEKGCSVASVSRRPSSSTSTVSEVWRRVNRKSSKQLQRCSDKSEVKQPKPGVQVQAQRNCKKVKVKDTSTVQPEVLPTSTFTACLYKTPKLKNGENLFQARTEEQFDFDFEDSLENTAGTSLDVAALPLPSEEKIKTAGEFTMELVRNFNKVPTRQDNSESPGFAYKPEKACRKKTERAKLQGLDCDICRKYYKAIASQLTDEEVQKIKDKCSRHRSKYKVNISETPPNYWDPDFPSTQECIDKGYMGIGSRSSSPQ